MYATDTGYVDSSYLYEMGDKEFVVGSITDVVGDLINSAHTNCHAFPTSFVPCLAQGWSVSEVFPSNWKSPEALLFPTPVPQHWILNVSDLKNARIYQMDTGGGKGTDSAALLTGWLQGRRW